MTRFNALKSFFNIQSKCSNMKHVLCPSYSLQELFDRIVLLHNNNTCRNRAERFDAKRTTNLWHLVPSFLHFIIINLVSALHLQNAPTSLSILSICSIHFEYRTKQVRLPSFSHYALLLLWTVGTLWKTKITAYLFHLRLATRSCFSASRHFQNFSSKSYTAAASQ